MNSVINPIKDVLAKLTFIPNDELKLAVIGGVVIIVFFLLAWIISAGSKMNALRKKIKKLIQKLADMQYVNESNVDEIYKSMASLPRSVQKGWGNFLDQRNGYPSDYITAKDALGGNAYSGKHTAGKVIFCVLSVIWWAVLGFFTLEICRGDLQVPIADNMSLLASLICVVLIPVAVFVLFYFILRAIYDSQRKRLELFFASMQDILDERVLVKDAVKADYDSETLKTIADRVNELIEGRMDDEGVIEVLDLPEGMDDDAPVEIDENDITTDDAPGGTTPVDDGIGDIVYPGEDDDETEGTDETEVTDETEETEGTDETEVTDETEETGGTEEETDETERSEPVILTQEEEEQYLAILPGVVDAAIADPNTTKSELEEIAKLIDDTIQNNFKDPKDQEILLDCLYRLADKFYEE